MQKAWSRCNSRRNECSKVYEPVLSKVDELEALLQNEEGESKELDDIDEAAVQAKVKEIEEGMHAISLTN